MRSAEIFRGMLRASYDTDSRFIVMPYGQPDGAMDVTDAVREALEVAARARSDEGHGKEKE